MSSFNRFLINTLLAGIASNTIWFALVFWVYLELGNLTVSSIVAATFPLTSSILSIYFGRFVDNRDKKTSMIVSSAISFAVFILASIIFFVIPSENLIGMMSPWFWIAVFAVLIGAVANNLRLITLSTLVTDLVDQNNHDKANGRIGVVNGVAFALTSVFSGILLGTIGMANTVFVVTIFSALILLDCYLIPYVSKSKAHIKNKRSVSTIRQGFSYLIAVPGLFALILFSTFNNFLGGIFMALSDPYGLELVSVQTWGFIWGILGVGFVIGGWLVSKYGLGKSPLRTLILTNGIVWFSTILFPLYSNIWITTLGFAVYMALSPFIEAAEQTVIQKVVEPEKQGRVFGTAQSVEMLASPITAITIGPFTQEVVLPFLQEGVGFDLIGSWFGSDIVRAMALVFIISGAVGVVATILAVYSKQYKLLLKTFNS
jgi:DHA3 family multidrug efflux protein-like MFS transporter